MADEDISGRFATFGAFLVAPFLDLGNVLFGTPSSKQVSQAAATGLQQPVAGEAPGAPGAPGMLLPAEWARALTVLEIGAVAVGGVLLYGLARRADA